jgi:hypothetical protein
MLVELAGSRSWVTARLHPSVGDSRMIQQAPRQNSIRIARRLEVSVVFSLRIWACSQWE